MHIYKNGFKKEHVKGPKIFLKKKNKKDEERPVADIELFMKTKKKKNVSIIGSIRNLCDKEKEKKVEYIRNYYSAHKK